MKKLQLLDSNSILMPCAYALPEMVSPDGLIVNGLFGYCRCVLNLLQDHGNCVIALFDKCPKNIRKQILSTYKQNRPPLNLGIKIQIELATEFCRQIGIPIEYNDYYEADDIIASYARKNHHKLPVEVYSIDKDLYQLVNDNTTIVHPFKKIKIDQQYVFNKYGVYPKEFHIFLSIVGDSADNIPGIKGIGPKTAANMIRKYPNRSDWPKIFKQFDFSNLDQMIQLTNLYDIDVSHQLQEVRINIEACKQFLEQMGFIKLIKLIK